MTNQFKSAAEFDDTSHFLPLPEELFRLYRQRSGLTQLQLATYLGLDTNRMVKKWESGVSLPEVNRLKQIVEFYLGRGVFVKGQEYQEILQFWNMVKNRYETSAVKNQLYPPFDSGWFARLAMPLVITPVSPEATDSADQTFSQVATGPLHNLPTLVSSFIGRDKEMAEFTRLWEDTRCLTLVGPGGIGKTRLALEKAWQMLEDFPDGVWFIELAALTASEQVAGAVARTLEIRGERGESQLSGIINALKDKELLLILDNCEHVISACAELVNELLTNCPLIKILATSRERVRIEGELSWRIPALALPEIESNLLQTQGFNPDLLSEIIQPPRLVQSDLPDSVKLLVERVRAVQPEFNLDESTALEVFELCRRLDGMPLAIELAAARARGFSIGQINARLVERFKLLSGGNAAALPRQQTLKALFDWSYDLLNDPERKLLRRLAVYQDGFSLEAVEAVCAGEGLETGEIAGLLLELLAQSLVIARPAGEGMLYSQLETIREYGRARLKREGAESIFDRKHFDFYLDFLTQLQGNPFEMIQAKAVTWIDREYTNCLKALNWALTCEDKDNVLKLGNKLFDYWEIQGYRLEGRQLLEKGLALPNPVDIRLETQTRLNCARFCDLLGDFDTGLQYAMNCLEAGRNLKDKSLIAGSLNRLGSINLRMGNYQAAWSNYEEELAIHYETNNLSGISSAKNNLGLIADYQSDFPKARQLYLEAIEYEQKIGNNLRGMNTLSNLGTTELKQGNYDLAWHYTEKSIEVGKALGNQKTVAASLSNLGMIAFFQGDYEKAKKYYLESLPLHLATGNRMFASNVLLNLGDLYQTLGDYPAARRYTLEAITIKRKLKDRLNLSSALNNLGNIAANQGDYPAALAHCMESLLLRQELGDKQGISSCYRNLGHLAFLQNDPLSAREYYRQSLALQQEIGNRGEAPLNLANLALASIFLGDLHLADQYLQEAADLGLKQKNQLNQAIILAVTVILKDRQGAKTADIPLLIEQVENHLKASQGVLEQVYLRPFNEVITRITGLEKPEMLREGL